MTDVNSPVRRPLELSTDTLIRRPTRPPDHSNGHAHTIEPIIPTTSSKPVQRQRRYTQFENAMTTFFCSGYLMTGNDNPASFILALVLLFGIAGVWYGTTGVWFWQSGTEYGLAPGGGIAINVILAYLFGITTSSMMVAAFRDPGIIPRNLDPSPPGTTHMDYFEAFQREVSVGKSRVPIKYCETCKTYRPPRTSHCRLCGNCVDGIDHHCSYIHTCVGKRNYFPFLVTLVFATICSIYVVIFSAIHFSLLCHHDDIYFSQALADSPGAAVSFLLGVVVLPGMLFLLWYHIRLLIYNLTTIEQIRASTSKSLFAATARPSENPFALSSRWKNVLASSLGRPQMPSWIDGAGFIHPDSRIPNPALTDPKWAEVP